MCMMKNSGEKEACEVANNLAALDGRVTKVEERMNKMEGSLNYAIDKARFGLT